MFSQPHPLSDGNTLLPEVSNMDETHLAILKRHTMLNIQSVECFLRINAYKPNREIPFRRLAANGFQYREGIRYICAWSESIVIFGLMFFCVGLDPLENSSTIGRQLDGNCAAKAKRHPGAT